MLTKFKVDTATLMLLLDSVYVEKKGINKKAENNVSASMVPKQTGVRFVI